MSDVMMLRESVLVGVLLECFKLGDDVKMLDLIVGRVKERLAKARLEDLETERKRLVRSYGGSDACVAPLPGLKVRRVTE